MNPRRRAWLFRLAALPSIHMAHSAARAAGIDHSALAFPRDHGAHLSARIEWWYATGWLGTEAAPTHGFQLTFFRSRTGLAKDVASRFARSEEHV